MLEELFTLLEEIFDLQLQLAEMHGRQNILLKSRIHADREEYAQIQGELKKVWDGCYQISDSLVAKEKELKKF